MEECSICLDDLNTDEIITECNHKFHKECLKKIYRLACPLCNTEIKSPQEVVEFIENNIACKKNAERTLEVQMDELLQPFQIFINSLLVVYYNEVREQNYRNRYPLYYRYESQWTWSEHLTNYMIACSHLYQTDEAEGITWSYDLDLDRTISEYNSENDLVHTCTLKISSLTNEANELFTNLFGLLSIDEDEDDSLEDSGYDSQ